MLAHLKKLCRFANCLIQSEKKIILEVLSALQEGGCTDWTVSLMDTPDSDFQNGYMELLWYSLPHINQTLSEQPSLNSLITLLKKQKQLRHCKFSGLSMKAASSNPNAAGGSPEIGFPHNINFCHQGILPAAISPWQQARVLVLSQGWDLLEHSCWWTMNICLVWSLHSGLKWGVMWGVTPWGSKMTSFGKNSLSNTSPSQNRMVKCVQEV